MLELTRMTYDETGKIMADWKIEFDSLPGPDRSKLVFVHDVIRPAATKDLAAVVYSVVEWRMGWEGGYFALFEGPNHTPKTLWCPEGLLCMGYQNVLQWLDRDRYVVANGYMYDGKNRVEEPFVFVDIEEERVAYFPFMNSCHAAIEQREASWCIRQRDHDPRFRSRHGEIIDRNSLLWKPWSEVDELKVLYWQGALGSAE